MEALRALPYADYLQTPTWRRRRDARLRVAGWRCERCARRDELQVHHVSYDRLGCERDADLEVVCRPCHEGVHLEEGRRGHTGLLVKLASEAIAAGLTNGTDLVDVLYERCAALRIPARRRAINEAVSVVLGRVPREPIRRLSAGLHCECAGATPISQKEADEICRRLGLVVPLRAIPSPAAFVWQQETRE